MSSPTLSGLKPINITLDRQKHRLLIEWNDTHNSSYDLSALREACPCAGCRGGHEFMGVDHDPDLITLTPVKTCSVLHLEVVGLYALQILWDDNHSAGIYTWDYLRRICPCEDCQSLRRTSS